MGHRLAALGRHQPEPLIGAGQLESAATEVVLCVGDSTARAVHLLDELGAEHRPVEVDGRAGPVNDEKRSEGGVSVGNGLYAHGTGFSGLAGKLGNASPLRGVVGWAGSAGEFDLDRWPPSPQAAEYVEHFWSVRWDLTSRAPHESTVIAFPVMHLTHEWGADRPRHSWTRRCAGLRRPGTGPTARWGP